ncbi:hypothetical protein E3T34_05020 [Cryobacterium sp. TMT1-62]|uniref:hypothetical protein n=1 Tax=Cryobacterium sp. TMT1-62 TaxID=1259240 RepID=UPI00106AD170|nr:hypothetical protein [Cryobacterium sp. TMT1-62]TFD34395.1 hypothetical protein E3T34_05020 [Cryobacterium sp. TMT1-62]
MADIVSRDRALSIRLMLIGAFAGIIAPIAGFLGGTIVGVDQTVGGLEPLFVWLFVGMIVGMFGVAIGILGALRWVKGGHHLD